MDGSWKIAELAELAAGVLTAGDQADARPARANGRVRDVPNERLIRWYVTVGLLDPPLSRRGRVAWYGPRHLLQLVAIKRRQAEGWSLAEIQAELAGTTNASLAGVARVPDAVLAADAVAARPDPARPGGARTGGAEIGGARIGGARTGGARTGGARIGGARIGGARIGGARTGGAAVGGATGPAARAARAPARAARPDPAPGRLDVGDAMAGDLTGAPARFWAQRPKLPAAAPARPGPGGEGGPPAARADAGQGAAAGRGDPARLAPAVRLAPGVALLLDGAEREPTPGDLAAIAAAAAPLLDVLASTRLRPADPPASLTAAAPGRPPDDPAAPERR